MNPKEFKISIFKNIKIASNPKNITLECWLKNTYYKSIQDEIRQSPECQDKQKRLKQSLPAATMSGTCTYRNEKHLQHNGLICIDIDTKDNKELFKTSSPDILKQKISKLPFVYLVAESVRAGLYALIQIENANLHREYFKSLQAEFKAIGVVIDKSCSDPIRARIYSYDANYKLNENATIYSKILKPEPKQASTPIKNTISTNELFNRCLSQIEATQTDITTGRIGWIKIASAIASEFGSGGLEFFHRVSCYHPEYEPKECKRTYLHIAKNPKCTISTFFNTCHNYGISYMI
ncbi:MAG: PriCT-2 domain-containing protein [Labilibaculum sp.]|nr:BT4734/BF3469 family protein [Labilibaculum sp.]MBI9057773.1 PriCT-2 domain-containing protein [Labilibaculum sp.]